MKAVLFDGQYHKSLLPLTYTRPVSFLRVGIFTIKEKWERYLGEEVSVRCKDFLANKFNSFEDSASIGILAALLPDPSIVIEKATFGSTPTALEISAIVLSAVKTSINFLFTFN